MERQRTVPLLIKVATALAAMSSAVGILAGGQALAERQSLNLDIPFLPPPVESDGRSILAFEIHATNFSDEDIGLRSLRVTDRDDGQTMASYGDQELNKRIRFLGAPSAPRQTTLRAGATAIIYVELYFATAKKPRAFDLEIDCADTAGHFFAVNTLSGKVTASRVPALGPPLHGGPWVAVHDPSWERGHRRVIYALDGKAHIPGRYAIDWVGIDDHGHTSKGDSDRPADAIGYNARVLAGADAQVADVRDGLVEASSIAGNPNHGLGEGSGNYVVLQLGDGQFAFYEHLRPGSIRVRRGDRVRLGQTIANLGFTGDTTGPHLHMHVADCLSPLACEGIPFRVRGMTDLGRYTSLADLGTKRWQAAHLRGSLRPEWPGYNVVIRFPDRAGPRSAFR